MLGQDLLSSLPAGCAVASTDTVARGHCMNGTDRVHHWRCLCQQRGSGMQHTPDNVRSPEYIDKPIGIGGCADGVFLFWFIGEGRLRRAFWGCISQREHSLSALLSLKPAMMQSHLW